MCVIELPCYGITVTLGGAGGGSITHSIFDTEEPAADEDERLLEAAVDGITSLILAHAVAGIDVKSPAYIEGIETAVEAASNHY
jgi:hypothetical protein